MSDDSDVVENVDRQIQHRTNTLMHVCWHRNTSVSMIERSIAVRVCTHLLTLLLFFSRASLEAIRFDVVVASLVALMKLSYIDLG